MTEPYSTRFLCNVKEKMQSTGEASHAEARNASFYNGVEYTASSKMTVTLYRPVGLHELALIFDSGCRAFPPRLPHQPIFYPVVNAEYAHQIARDWNTPDEASGYCGFVTRFAIAKSYLEHFEPKTVGASMHVEYWIP